MKPPASTPKAPPANLPEVAQEVPPSPSGQARPPSRSTSALTESPWTGFFDANFLQMKFRRSRSIPHWVELAPRLLLDARTELLNATNEMEESALELMFARERGGRCGHEVRRQENAARTWAEALLAFDEVGPRSVDEFGSVGCQPYLRFLNPVPDEDEVEKTAFHEAGHAVVGVFLGIEIGHVTIVPNPERGSVGQVTIRAAPMHPWPSQIEAAVLMTFAGQYAACRRFPDHVPDGFQDDFQKATEIIARCAARRSQRRKLEQDLRERSLWLVDRLSPAIGDVAKRLLKKMTSPVGEVMEAFECIPRARRQPLIEHPWALRQAMARDFQAEMTRCRQQLSTEVVEKRRLA